MVSEQVETIRRNWEEFVVAGLEAREQKDDSSWKLGDLALELTTEYGEDTIGKFAYAIGVERKTLMNYRTTAATYKPEIRAKYKKLSFSHFACAASMTKPEAWLEKADNEELSVESLRNLIKDEYAEFNPPDLSKDEPEVYRCPECGMWRLKDITSLEICKGHYKFNGGKVTYS